MANTHLEKQEILDLVKKQDYLGAKKLMDTLYHRDLSSTVANTFFREELIGLCLHNNSIDGLFLAFHPFSHHENSTELFNTPKFICEQIIEMKQYFLLEDALLAGYINFKDLNKYFSVDFPDLFHYIENHTDIKLHGFDEPLNFENTFKNRDIALVKKAILTKQNSLMDLTKYFVESKNIEAFDELQNNSHIKLDSNSLFEFYDKFFTDFTSSTPKILNLVKKDFTPGYYVLSYALSEAIHNYQLKAIDHLFATESEKMLVITKNWLTYMRSPGRKYSNDQFNFFDSEKYSINKPYFIDVLLQFKKYYTFKIDEPIQHYFIDLFVQFYPENKALMSKTMTFLQCVSEIENTPIAHSVYDYIQKNHAQHYPQIEAIIEKHTLEQSIELRQDSQNKFKL